MYRVSLPYTTRTTGIDILDTDNLFRQREIDTQIAMLNRDDGTFNKALDLWSTKEPVNQPIYFWVEDDMLPIHTLVNYAAGYAATATSIVVDDARLFIVNSEVHVPRTLENMLVTAVDYSTSTITVTRGWNGSIAVALVDNDELIGGVAHLAEMADANDGTGRIPGTEKYNYVSFFSESFKVSDLQSNCAMFQTSEGKVATVEWEVANKMFEIKRKVNKALIFQSRGTSTTSDGTIYCSQGFVHYVEDNVLNLGELNDTLTWPVLSAWFDTMFEPSASSTEKLVMCGLWLFGAVLRMSRDMGIAPVKYFHPDLQTDMIDVVTESGNTVKFAKDLHGFPASEGLAGWGIVADMAHVYKREHAGYPMAWRQNVQHAKSHFRQDEYFGSFSLELRHPEVHGYIRGAQKAIVD
jgi:hypothetical protein